MSKRLICALIFSALLICLSACKNETKQTDPSITTTSIINEFKATGLEAENVSDLPEKEFGDIRKDGKQILTPKFGDNKGGRIFEFDNEKDLKETKRYFDELGNTEPIQFSYTYTKGNFLLQMNGAMGEKEFNKYKNAMDKVVK
ncbi:stress protein [Bacillus toyonensis]|uniref:stress protein n=1 Tax=Bacillus toyonensis TaxID=155322 RepID=UPI000BEE0BDC|nr:stress protein [Bacillus toyonensis]PEC65313.1 stress protein [Bacillus toyonensis]